jgi:hypothetical protein
MSPVSRTRYRLILSGAFLLLLIAALWSMPLQAQDGRRFAQQATYRPTLTPLPVPVALLLTINTSSCVLSVVAQAPVEAAPARPTYRPTLTPVAPAEDTSAPVAVESFALGNAPTYTIGEGCDAVAERLSIPTNDIRWLSISVDGDDITFLPLQAVPGDPFPPQLDVRGRYFACGIPEE